VAFKTPPKGAVKANREELPVGNTHWRETVFCCSFIKF